MQCPKGSECRESSHEVKTLSMASEWYELVEKFHLPITVNQATASNGRVMISIYDNSGLLIHKRG